MSLPTDVYANNEILAVLARYDSWVVIALSDCMNSVQEIVELLEPVFLYVDSLCNVAVEMVDEGYFFPIPSALKSYIDYEKIARSLMMVGCYMHYVLKIAACLHS